MCQRDEPRKRESVSKRATDRERERDMGVRECHRYTFAHQQGAVLLFRKSGPLSQKWSGGPHLRLFTFQDVERML